MCLLPVRAVGMPQFNGATFFMEKYNHLIGKKFNRLTILFFVVKRVNIPHYQCKCDCGKETLVSIYEIINNKTKSCGCLLEENQKRGNLIHGEAKRGNWKKEFRVWVNIRQRCYNTNCKAYKNYGGRGIIVCERWMISFQDFLQDIGRAPSPDHSLERIDNDGNYEPGNCKWVTRKEQNNNTRRNFFIEYMGRTQTCAQWCEELGLNYDRVHQRIRRWGYSVDKAFTKP